MKKVEILKRIGKVALQVAGVDAVAGDSDRARMLEAQKELIELRMALATEALNDLYLATVVHVQEPSVLSSSTLTRELAEAHAIITMLRERD